MPLSKDWKFYLGIILLILSCLIPFLGFWIASLPWPVAVKGVIIGLLTVGGPEVVALLAVALLGKTAFDLIADKARACLRQLAPRGSVSLLRYRIGLALFILSFIPSYVVGYAPHLLPDVSPARLYVSIGSDVLYVISLFVLGGDFWDKLRALFVHDARAQFQNTSSGSAQA